MDNTKQGGSSEMMTTLIAYDWKELLGPLEVDPADISRRAEFGLTP